MKRIDDYSQKELAAMGEEDFNTLVETEAMVAGISKPPPLPELKYEDFPPQENLHRIYAVACDRDYSGPVYFPVAFKNEAAAQKVADLVGSLGIGKYTHSHYSKSTFDPSKESQVVVSCVHVPDEQAARVYENQTKAIAERNTAAKQARDEIAEAHQKYEDVAAKCRSKRWAAQSARDDAKRMFDELARFTQLANGDNEVAEKFLIAKWGAEVVAQNKAEWASAAQ